MTHRIEILITPEGKTSVQTQGFAGSSCQEASRFLEEALGTRVTQQRTAEFYQVQAGQEHQRHRTV